MPQDFFTGVNESRLFPTLSNILERRRQRELTNKLLTGDVTDLNNVGTYLGEGGDLGTLNTLLALRKMNMPTYSTEQVGNALFELKKDSMGQNLQQPRKLTEVIPPITPYQAQKEQREAAEFQSNQVNKELDRRLKEKALQTNVVPVTNPDGSITYQVIQTPKVGGKPTVQDTEKNVPQKAAGGGLAGAKMQAEAAQLTALESNLKQYSEGLAKVQGGRIGGTVSKIGAAVELNPQARAIQGLENTLTGLIARAISREVGVITEGDVERAKSMLPLITDNNKERKLKFDQIYKAIADRKKALQQTTPAAPQSDEFDKMTNEQLLQYINKK